MGKASSSKGFGKYVTRNFVILRVYIKYNQCFSCANDSVISTTFWITFNFITIEKKSKKNHTNISRHLCIVIYVAN